MEETKDATPVECDQACRLSLDLADRAVDLVLKLVEMNRQNDEVVQRLTKLVEAESANPQLDDYVKTMPEHLEPLGRAIQESLAHLHKDNQNLSKINRELNAVKNKIHTVAANDREPGQNGRPPGQPATKNWRPSEIDREEIVDVYRCPGCGGKLSGVTDTWDRVVTETKTITKRVKYTMNRRYCCRCKKQVSNKPPNVAPYARTSANHSAAMVSLNMSGLSHGKTAEFATEVLGVQTSRSGSYRNKMNMAKKLAPEHETIKEDILKEKILQCDEIWWPTLQNGSVGIVALGDNNCLVTISTTASIEAFQKMLPGYVGIIVQDSKTAWLHVGGGRQLCMVHRIRTTKEDLKYGNLKGDALRLVTGINRLDRKHYGADKISDPHTRKVAARCLDRERSELINRDWEDDEHGTIARYRKKHRREGYHLSTHLSLPGVPIDNNAVERMNRRFVAIRSDGGGNRSKEGMEANSILFTILATDRIRGDSFFEHVLRAACGDG